MREREKRSYIVIITALVILSFFMGVLSYGEIIPQNLLPDTRTQTPIKQYLQENYGVSSIDALCDKLSQQYDVSDQLKTEVNNFQLIPSSTLPLQSFSNDQIEKQKESPMSWGVHEYTTSTATTSPFSLKQPTKQISSSQVLVSQSPMLNLSMGMLLTNFIVCAIIGKNMREKPPSKKQKIVLLLTAIISSFLGGMTFQGVFAASTNPSVTPSLMTIPNMNITSGWYSGATDVTSALLGNFTGATAYVGFDTTQAYRDNYLFCDGTADDVQINAAISYVGSMGGGLIHICSYPTGVTYYDITASIVDGGYSNIILEGEGWNTVLRLANGAETHVIHITDESDWTIRDLNIDGNRINQTLTIYAIRGERVTDCVVQNVYAHDARAGIEFEEACSNIWVNQCKIENMTLDGIDFDGHSDARNQFCMATENIVISTDQASIVVDYCDHSIVDSNIIRLCGTHSIHLWNEARWNVVSDNISYDDVSNGIRLEDGSNYNVISGNNLYSSNSQGIRVDASHHNLISGNYCYEPQWQGIDLIDASDNRVIGNYCSDSSRGIMLESDSNDNFISNNKCIGCTQGIRIDAATCNDNWVIGNDLRGNTTPLHDDGTDTVLPTISGEFNKWGGGSAGIIAPVINTSPGGIDIDADNEFCYVDIPLKTEIQQVVRIKIWAYSNLIEATNNMHLRIVAHGAGSSELWSGNPIDVINHPSEETGGIVQFDIIHWVIDAGDDAQVGTLAAQDLVELMVVGETGVAPDITTDALFGGWEIEFV